MQRHQFWAKVHAYFQSYDLLLTPTTTLRSKAAVAPVLPDWAPRANILRLSLRLCLCCLGWGVCRGWRELMMMMMMVKKKKKEGKGSRKQDS